MMEQRLTHKTGSLGAVPTQFDIMPLMDLDNETWVGIQDIFDRLSAYEDCLPLERAQELAKAEQDGRLVVLPCRVGQTVFINTKCSDIMMYHDNGWERGTGSISCPFENNCPHEECDDNNKVTLETECSQFVSEDDGSFAPIFECVLANFSNDDFGKSIFFAREEAEAATQQGGDGDV